jgi:hypothetical protein
MYICTRGPEEEPLVRKRRDNRQIGLGNGAENRIVKIRRETWRRYLIPLEAQKMMLVAEECLGDYVSTRRWFVNIDEQVILLKRAEQSQ